MLSWAHKFEGIDNTGRLARKPSWPFPFCQTAEIRLFLILIFNQVRQLTATATAASLGSVSRYATTATAAPNSGLPLPPAGAASANATAVEGEILGDRR